MFEDEKAKGHDARQLVQLSQNESSAQTNRHEGSSLWKELSKAFGPGGSKLIKQLKL
jgi:hypothetical protein